jgi:hypothetical protein
MAADLIERRTTEHGFVHDLESAFYVILWLSVKYLPNTFNYNERGSIINTLFNPPILTDGATRVKSWWMARGTQNLQKFNITGNDILGEMLRSLVPYFEARYQDIEEREKEAEELKRRSKGKLRILDVAMAKCSKPDTTGKRENIDRYLEGLKDHRRVIEIIETALSMKEEWPENEEFSIQVISRLKEELGRASSKRLNSGYEVSGSSQKRHRTE